MSATLRDLGERYILEHIIPEYCDCSGSDCATLSMPSGVVVVTTDPAPVPAANVIGGDPDPYWIGWLLVVINASDLAAAGANPLGFLSALELDPDCEIDFLRRLLLGTRDACQAEGLRYVGGNLKEGSRLSAVGTAIGHAMFDAGITRRGARPGDVLVSVGRGGIFWRDALSTSRGSPSFDKMRSPLFAPRSQLGIMADLAQQHVINAAIDNSDGLLPSLTQLSTASSVGITVDMERLVVPDAAHINLDPARLWLGWGDWNVLAAISQLRLDDAHCIAEKRGADLTIIGTFSDCPGVFLRRQDRIIPAPRLESERFASDSWFSEGIQGYIDRLLSVELP